jgi:alginate O-acetyltransferase complex protein AlgI
MLFSSPLFLFLFLPVVLLVYFVVPRGVRNSFLVLASILFYAWGEGVYSIMMLLSMSINYVFGRLIDDHRNQARWILALAVAVNLAPLIFFKYLAFFVHNAAPLLQVAGVRNLRIDHVHLPLGISFFTFHSISYLVDIYRRDAAAQRSPVDLALYISFFPQLIAGPIIRYHDIADQLRNRIVRAEDFAIGIQRFIIGLAKKVIIANTVAGPADQIFALPSHQLTAPLAWLGIICYTFQIYFDFSGYSDMAIGLARMFGFRFLENFNYPYISGSIQEFWRRWHISLSNWFRDYLYVPLGGNRVAPARVYFNLVLVFLLCGLWHGASWNFVLWGALHGTFLIFERLGLARLLARVGRWLAHTYTLLIVIIGWVFFRADTLPRAIGYLRAMAGFGRGNGLEYNAGLYLDNELKLILVLALIGATPIASRLAKMAASERQGQAPTRWSGWSLSIVGDLYLATIFVVSASYLAAGTYNPFIYFRF